MSKNVKAKAKARKNATAKRGPGRPKYVPIIPRGKFTFSDLETANGVNLETGKGERCTTLTLRKWVKREVGSRKGAIIRVKNILAEPNSESGLGRKQYVFIRRPAENTPKAVKPSTEKAPAQTTADYEATKKALLAETAVPVDVAPAAVETPAEPVAA